MAVTIMFVKNFVACALLILCIAHLVSSGKPPLARTNDPVFTISANCRTDVELLDLCQRCAKLTKSRKAYPLCCSIDLDARRWCYDFVYFGTGPYSFN